MELRLLSSLPKDRKRNTISGYLPLCTQIWETMSCRLIKGKSGFVDTLPIFVDFVKPSYFFTFLFFLGSLIYTNGLNYCLNADDLQIHTSEVSCLSSRPVYLLVYLTSALVCPKCSSPPTCPGRAPLLLPISGNGTSTQTTITQDLCSHSFTCWPLNFTFFDIFCIFLPFLICIMSTLLQAELFLKWTATLVLWLPGVSLLGSLLPQLVPTPQPEWAFWLEKLNALSRTPQPHYF